MGVFDVILSYVTNSAMQLMLSLITDVIGSKAVKINYEKLFDEFLECVGDTQKEFARHYNEKYESDTTTLFSHILYILANREFEKAELDEIVEQFIRNSFNTEPTNQMIEDWKRYLVENINDAQYSGLKIYLTSIKENHDVAYVKEEEAHYGTTSIFLSYSWEDEEKADEIDTFFKALGASVHVGCRLQKTLQTPP